MAGGLEFGEAFEIAAVGAGGGIDAALEVGEGAVDGGVGDGEGMGVVAWDAAQVMIPDMSFDVGKAFEERGVVGDGGDEELLVGGSGLEAAEEGAFEGSEGVGVFAGDGAGFGEDAVLEGVEVDGGFAGGGAGSGGFAGVATIGVDLFGGGHLVI